MDIQRGDQVYYRGELWEVRGVTGTSVDSPLLWLFRLMSDGYGERVKVLAKDVQRVEQVR